MNSSASLQDEESLNNELSDKNLEKIILAQNQEAMQFLAKGEIEKAHSKLRNCEFLLVSEFKIRKSATLNQLLGITLNNMGIYHKRTKKPKVALKYLKKALQIELYSTNDKSAIGSTHLNISALLSSLGDHATALNHAKLANELLDVGRETLENVKNNNGYRTETNIIVELDENDQVIGEHVEQEGVEVKDLNEKMNNVHINFIISFINLGVEYEYLLQYENALNIFNEGLKFAKQVVGMRHRLSKTLVTHLKNIKDKIQEKKKKDKVKIDKMLKEAEQNYTSLIRMKSPFKLAPIHTTSTPKNKQINEKDEKEDKNYVTFSGKSIKMLNTSQQQGNTESHFSREFSIKSKGSLPPRAPSLNSSRVTRLDPIVKSAGRSHSSTRKRLVEDSNVVDKNTTSFNIKYVKKKNVSKDPLLSDNNSITVLENSMMTSLRSANNISEEGFDNELLEFDGNENSKPMLQDESKITSKIKKNENSLPEIEEENKHFATAKLKFKFGGNSTEDDGDFRNNILTESKDSFIKNLNHQKLSDEHMKLNIKSNRNSQEILKLINSDSNFASDQKSPNMRQSKELTPNISNNDERSENLIHTTENNINKKKEETQLLNNASQSYYDSFRDESRDGSSMVFDEKSKSNLIGGNNKLNQKEESQQSLNLETKKPEAAHKTDSNQTLDLKMSFENGSASKNNINNTNTTKPRMKLVDSDSTNNNKIQNNYSDQLLLQSINTDINQNSFSSPANDNNTFNADASKIEKTESNDTLNNIAFKESIEKSNKDKNNHENTEIVNDSQPNIKKKDANDQQLSSNKETTTGLQLNFQNDSQISKHEEVVKSKNGNSNMIVEDSKKVENAHDNAENKKISKEPSTAALRKDNATDNSKKSEESIKKKDLDASDVVNFTKFEVKKDGTVKDVDELNSVSSKSNNLKELSNDGSIQALVKKMSVDTNDIKLINTRNDKPSLNQSENDIVINRKQSKESLESQVLADSQIGKGLGYSKELYNKLDGTGEFKFSGFDWNGFFAGNDSQGDLHNSKNLALSKLQEDTFADKQKNTHSSNSKIKNSFDKLFDDESDEAAGNSKIFTQKKVVSNNSSATNKEKHKNEDFLEAVEID